MAADDCLGSADKRQRPEKVDSEEQPAPVTVPASNSDYNGNADGSAAEATTHNNNNNNYLHGSVEEEEDSNQSPEEENNSKPTTTATTARHTLSTGGGGVGGGDDEDEDVGGDSVGEINNTLRRRAVHGGGGGGGGDDENVVNSNTNTTTTTTTTTSVNNSSGTVGFNAHSSSSVNVSGTNTGTTAEVASPSQQPPPPPPSSSSSSSPSSSRLCITSTTTTTTASTTTTSTTNNNNTSLKTYSSNSTSNTSNPAASVPTTMNAREYAQVVRTWLWQYHQWNSMCAFSMMLPYYAMATFPYYAANNYPGFPTRTNSASSASATPSSSSSSPAYPLANANPAASGSGASGGGNNNNNMQGAAAGGGGGGAAARGMNVRQAGHGGPHQTPQPAAARPADQPLRATEYIIPSLWKRILAELVDFVLLFYIKLIVSVMVMKQMGYIDLDKYDLEYNWYVAMDDFDISKMFHFTSEMILFELLNRISITIVETMCLQRGIGVVGGSTPGKRLLGMKVVSCTEISDLGNGRIRVTPAQDIGLNSALLRSVLKNFTIAFFFPACLTVFFFDHNRAAYDVLAGSIVVQPIEEAGEV